MATPRESLVIRAAELYYERNLGQREIARILGTSVSTVSRLIADARSSGIVHITIDRPVDSNPLVAEACRKEFKLRDVLVVNRDASENDPLRAIGVAAAGLLRSVLRENLSIGITWGRSPYHMVEAVGRTEVAGTSVVQMVGSLGRGNPSIDGPELAMRLANQLGGTYRYVNSPAVVESAEVCRQLKTQPQIRETLSAAESSDIMISGIGSLADPSSSLERAGYLDSAERMELLDRGGVGHILARAFDITGAELHDFNSRVVGIPLDALTRAEWSICLCETTIKSGALLSAIRGGYFNALVITEEAALKLLSLAGTPYSPAQ